VYLRFVKEETRFEDTDWKPERRSKKKKRALSLRRNAKRQQQRRPID
jgi:hypothetical protein